MTEQELLQLENKDISTYGSKSTLADNDTLFGVDGDGDPFLMDKPSLQEQIAGDQIRSLETRLTQRINEVEASQISDKSTSWQTMRGTGWHADYRLNQIGQLELYIIANETSGGNVSFVLPAGFRPLNPVGQLLPGFDQSGSTGTNATIQINSASSGGNVIITGATVGTYYLNASLTKG